MRTKDMDTSKITQTEQAVLILTAPILVKHFLSRTVSELGVTTLSLFQGPCATQQRNIVCHNFKHCLSANTCPCAQQMQILSLVGYPLVLEVHIVVSIPKPLPTSQLFLVDPPWTVSGSSHGRFKEGFKAFLEVPICLQERNPDQDGLLRKVPSLRDC